MNSRLKRTPRRGADGALDLADLKPWRVDRFATHVFAALKDAPVEHRIIETPEEAKKLLRIAVQSGVRGFEEYDRDEELSAAKTTDKRRYGSALKAAISGLEHLIDAGPLPATINREDDDGPARAAKEAYYDATCRIDRLASALADLQELQRDFTARRGGKIGPHDPALRVGFLAMIGTLAFVAEVDEDLFRSILVEAWQDAGFPDGGNRRNGDTIRDHVVKYLNNIG